MIFANQTQTMTGAGHSKSASFIGGSTCWIACTNCMGAIIVHTWVTGNLQVCLSKSGNTTGRPCAFSSSVYTAEDKVQHSMPPNSYELLQQHLLTCEKYSSAILVAQTLQRESGRQGLEMSAHLTRIFFMIILFSWLISLLTIAKLVVEPVSLPSTCSKGKGKVSIEAKEGERRGGRGKKGREKGRRGRRGEREGGEERREREEGERKGKRERDALSLYAYQGHIEFCQVFKMFSHVCSQNQVNDRFS